ncbi:MAG: methyltransferase domain-containing protein [Proteobacteria bacterium]|nr:methyltransferase domain-containing protein [Pseudomonadota bacterium]
MKLVFVVQANYYNWEGSLDFSVKPLYDKPVFYWVVKKILDAWPGAAVVIAAPDLEENRVMQPHADELGVKLYYGAEQNVLDRLIEAGRLSGAESIVRVLGQHYFFDTDLVGKMMEQMATGGYDVVKAPDDFEIKFTAEVVKMSALESLQEMIGTNAELGQRSDVLISPVHYIASHSELFNVSILTDLPVYTTKELYAKREEAAKIYDMYDGDHIPFLTANPSDSALFRHYEIAAEYIDSDSVVLDIACGDGYGSSYLAGIAAKVVGVDVSEKQVEAAGERYRAANLGFFTGDATNTSFADGSFDVITSMETIEHIEDDKAYLKELWRVLKPNGRFILSTPQNSIGSVPLIPTHVREYALEEFKELLGANGFEIVRMVGFKAGNLTIEGDAVGSGMMAICRKSGA